MACARTVAVVVPSPAMSEVFEATSRTICAPMFSCASFSSISFATVTPSLVMVGEPNFFSITTLRPLGPSVTFTASASRFTPRRIACRESSPCTICFAIYLFSYEVLEFVVIPSGRLFGHEGSGRLPRILLARSSHFLLGRARHHAEDLFLAHDDEIFSVQLDLGPG